MRRRKHFLLRLQMCVALRHGFVASPANCEPIKPQETQKGNMKQVSRRDSVWKQEYSFLDGQIQKIEKNKANHSFYVPAV